ncbi:MAG TPA: hypothetical protein VKS22_10670 [Candidatus Binataceae bacterium]|nr:hypothetical protein [Candidatus Binataceae bacterium]
MGHGIIALFALIVGAILGGVGQIYTSFREGSGLADALKAEIESLVILVEMRGYLTSLEGLTTLLEAGAHPDVPYLRVERSYFGIFEASRSKIGLLGAAAAPVVESYAFANAFLEDMRTLADFSEKGQIGNVAMKPGELELRVRSAREVLKKALDRGKVAAEELKARSNQWFLRELLCLRI